MVPYFFLEESLIKNLTDEPIQCYSHDGDFVVLLPAILSHSDAPETAYVVDESSVKEASLVVGSSKLFRASKPSAGRDGKKVSILLRYSDGKVRVMPIKGR